MARYNRDRQLLYWLQGQIAQGTTSVGYEYVENYDALPPSPADRIYVVLNSQGTWWLPGGLGGTYKPKGLYKYINSAWTFLGESPSAATLNDALQGTNTSLFISPKTLNDWFVNTVVVSATEPTDPLPGTIWIDIS